MSSAVSPAADAAVIRPDFASKRRHFIFTDEHDRLRESIGSFVEKELQPHAEEWEVTTCLLYTSPSPRDRS